jgi:hypothetical protein
VRFASLQNLQEVFRTFLALLRLRLRMVISALCSRLFTLMLAILTASTALTGPEVQAMELAPREKSHSTILLN